MPGDAAGPTGAGTVEIDAIVEHSHPAGGMAAPPVPMEARIGVGSVIGDLYEVRGIRGGEGKSGMGVVYVCHDRRARQTYALKALQDRYRRSDRMRDSFLHEALAWVLLDCHPNIVQAVSVEALDGRLFIVLEYVEPDDLGRNTLSQHLKAPIASGQALRWALQFCDGMAYAASRGITPHRDIKPDNLMVSRDGTLKITDFGLARLWEGTLRSYDADGHTPAGTAPWMAPEQFEGAGDLRSDIYGFGVILHQMASGGRVPFAADSIEEYRRMHAESPVPRLSSPLFPVIRKCLGKTPSERYGDFRGLRTDLERVHRSLLRLEPPPPASTIRPDPWEYNNRGLALYNVGLLDEAVWLYRRALRAEPSLAGRHARGFARVHNNLGVAYDARKQADRAIGEYREAIRLDPRLAAAHNNLGAALRARGLFEEAAREYAEALAITPESPGARHSLGLCYACRGEFDLAIREYGEALRRKPAFVEARINLGLARAMKGDLDGALDEYATAARLWPDDAVLHYNRASALRARGQTGDAMAEYRVSLGIDATNARAHYQLGLCLADSGDIPGAMGEFRAALRLEHGRTPSPGEIRRELAKSGLPPDAETALARLLCEGGG